MSDGWVEVSRFANLAQPEGQGYGCWFVRAPGSGLWIHRGRSRSFANRSEAQRWLCGAIRARQRKR